MTKALIENLYKAVDDRNVEKLSEYLSDNVRFRIANFDVVHGKPDVLAANKSFFESISSMSHTLGTILSKGNTVVCDGVVNYVRKDGSPHSAHFATILKLQNGLIEDYFVYADISDL